MPNNLTKKIKWDHKKYTSNPMEGRKRRKKNTWRKQKANSKSMDLNLTKYKMVSMPQLKGRDLSDWIKLKANYIVPIKHTLNIKIQFKSRILAKTLHANTYTQLKYHTR